MSERALNNTIKKSLDIYGTVDRVENRICKGYPDWTYTLCSKGFTVSGYIESKYLLSWPKKPTTPVIIRSLTREQVLWLKKIFDLGGRAYLILKVGRRCYLLLTAPVVESLFDRKLTAIELIAQACVYSSTGFPKQEILEMLTIRTLPLKEAA